MEPISSYESSVSFSIVMSTMRSSSSLCNEVFSFHDLGYWKVCGFE